MFRKSLKISILSLGILAGGLLSSCTNENEPTYAKPGTMLVKAPEMNAFSGNHTWGKPGGTRSANVNGNLWYQEWDRPSNVTDEEIAKVLEKVSEPRVGAVNEITITWENFWVQQVYKGETSYSDYWGNNRGPGSEMMNELQVWNDNVEVWWPEHKFGGYETVNNFNRGDNQTQYTDDENHYVFEGTTLMTNMSGGSASNQFAYKNSADGGQLYFDYIVIEVDGEYYVCFDFYADNRDNPGATANKDHYIDRDWVFNDWIVKISPAYHKGETPETPVDPKPEIPGGGEVTIPDEPLVTFPSLNGVCIACGHEAHDNEYCEECQDGECTAPKKTLDEVEVNLALDKKNDDLLESHLSMHVRSATDVEVFIPVPAQYYCAADDMAIVMDHVENFVHGGPYSTQYEIGENIVTLNVEFTDGGIRVWTEGITQDVIDYCWENFGDGVTFEVWNYFNDPETGLPYISMEELKGYLDQATVRFIDKVPGQYVNAFGRENGKYSDGNPDGKDFHVTPKDQLSSFDAPYEGPHYNDSDNNDIYAGKKE